MIFFIDMNYKMHNKNRKKKFSLTILLIITTFTLSNIVYIAWAETIPTVSTRGHFDKSSGSSTSSQFYKPLSDEVLDNICRESEAVIYVHGVWTNEKGHSLKAVENAQEIFDRLKMSLKDAEYNHPLVGFSWDSDTQIDPEGVGWNIAKLIAKENGPKLAKFIIDLKNYCIEHHGNNIKLRLVAHSLGSRVILSALDSLNNNNIWKSSHFKISTVNLLGGAVDNYEVLKNNNEIPIHSNIKAFYGNAIQNQVINFYNMYNFEDDVLEEKIYAEWDEPIYYPWYEGDDMAIGQNPLLETASQMPSNYKNIDVQDEIIYEQDADKDGDECDLPNLYYKSFWGLDICTIVGHGDNHLGYIGFRNLDKSLMDNGAIDEVVKSWTLS
jgi:hypothetical protein